MPDLTLDEYRGLPQEALGRILREEALRICGKPLSESGAVNPSVKLAVSDGPCGPGDEKRFSPGDLQGFCSPLHLQTDLSATFTQANQRP